MHKDLENGRMEYQHIRHTFAPVYDENSRILILGTLPSVQSRKQHFYYGHPQNRFWKLLALLVEPDGTKVPQTIEEKKAFLLRNHIAIWDVVAECDILGSLDSSIRNVTAADLVPILEQAPIQSIYANGGKAQELYQKYTYEKTKREIIRLPSTSPANAAFTMERLLKAWSVILKEL